ncbi:hypothetical protein BH18ACT10_BH18ACT10_00330 [soil metagenome]
MRAMVTPEFGSPDLFEEQDVERPEPGPGEILVRVAASETNPIDAKFRAAGDSMGLEVPMILGANVSGVVEEVDPGVDALASGDELYYTPEVFGAGSNGGYAEYHLAPAYLVAKKPASVSHEEAAAVPLAGGTAHEALVGRLDVKVGETVLIDAGAGGVGSFAIQIAKAAGARVLATAGPDNQETLTSLGADVAIDYSSQDFVDVALEDTAEAGADAVLDAVGGDTVMNSIAATRPFGRLATILGAQGGHHLGSAGGSHTDVSEESDPARCAAAPGTGAARRADGPDRTRSDQATSGRSLTPERSRQGPRAARLRARAGQDRAASGGGLRLK